MSEDFDFEEWRKRFPLHWDRERGWPAQDSTWRFRDHPQMRIRVIACDHEFVQAEVHWDSDLDEFQRLFSYENRERWAKNENGLMSGARGFDRERRWRDEGPPLWVTFDRAMFGGPDTWQVELRPQWEGINLPPFEPIEPWKMGRTPMGFAAPKPFDSDRDET
jgi:hypothetical protein